MTEYREYVRISDLDEYLTEFGFVEVSGTDCFENIIKFKVQEINTVGKSKYVVYEYGNYYDGPKSLDQADRKIMSDKMQALIYVVDQLGGCVNIDWWGEVE